MPERTAATVRWYIQQISGSFRNYFGKNQAIISSIAIFRNVLYAGMPENRPFLYGTMTLKAEHGY